MAKQAISDRMPAVTIEYSCRNKRATKDFEDANEAKKFYAAKEKAGRNPKVLKQEEPAAEPKKGKKEAAAPA